MSEDNPQYEALLQLVDAAVQTQGLVLTRESLALVVYNEAHLKALRAIAIRFSRHPAQYDEPLFMELIQTLADREPLEVTVVVNSTAAQMARAFANLLRQLFMAPENKHDFLQAAFDTFLDDQDDNRRLMEWCSTLAMASSTQEPVEALIAATVNAINSWSAGLRVHDLKDL